MLSDSLIRFTKISVARVLAALGMFLLSVAIGQQFGPGGLGEFTLWLSIAIACGLVSRLGLDGCLLKLAAVENNADKNYSLYKAYWSSVTSSFAGSLGAIALIIFAMRLMGWPLSTLAVWMVLSIPGLTLLGIVAGYQRGRDNNTLVALIDVGGVGAVTFLALFGALNVGFGKSIDFIALLFFLVSSVMAIIGIILCAYDMSKRSHHSGIGDLNLRETFHKDQLHFAIVLVGGFVMQAGSFPLAANSLDNETIGILRAAERLTTLVVFPTIAINLMLTSKISRDFSQGSTAGMVSSIMKSVWASLMISVLAASPLVFFPEFFLHIFGPQFVGGKNYLFVLIIAQVLIATSSPILSALSYTNQGNKSSKVTVVSAIIGIILFPLLSHFYGGPGFVTAYLIVAFSKAAMSATLGARLFRAGCQ